MYHSVAGHSEDTTVSTGGITMDATTYTDPPPEVPTTIVGRSPQPQYHIIGDVYVDILCYIPSRVGNNNIPPTTAVELKLDGTDTALQQPITIMAGGSTINTATYLQYLQRLPLPSQKSTGMSLSSSSSLSSSWLDITVHTAFNPNDYYGSILLQHSIANHITLKNGFSYDITMSSSESETSPTSSSQQQQQQQQQQQDRSTPHCMVMISSYTTATTAATPSGSSKEIPSTTTATTTTATISSERTFLTHRGCATNNMYVQNLFPRSVPSCNISPSSLSFNGNATSTTESTATIRPPLHYHIAGYYCTPEFWDTTHNSVAEFVENLYQHPPPSAKSSSENGCSSDHPTTTTTTKAITHPVAIDTTPLILSLVTQYDATQQWDMSNLVTILPYMHICIMNELEAQQIYYSNCRNDDNFEDSISSPTDIEGTASTSASRNENENVDPLLLGMISFFTKFNASTIYVITRGVKGAIAFRNHSIIAQVHGTVNATSIVATNGVDVRKDIPTDANGMAKNHNVIIDPTGAGDAFCAGLFHSLWQSLQCTTTTDPRDVTVNNSSRTLQSLYRPSEMYWPNANAIQDALLYGCTIGTCSILQRGGSTVPTSDHDLVQIVHEQYKQLVRPPPLLNGLSQEHR